MSRTIETGRIQDGAVTAAQLAVFNPEQLPHAARAQWEQLGRRIALLDAFDRAHPTLYKLRSLPLFRHLYARRMRAYVLGLEPPLEPKA